MILDKFEKKLALFAVFCSLTLFIMLPISSGYGTTMKGATVITNGTTNEQMTAGQWVYYKICCNAGDTLRINLTYYAGDELNFLLYSPSSSEFPVDGGLDIGEDDWVIYPCGETGYYIIAVHHVSGTLPATINLIVSGATGSDCNNIPGFEGIMTFVGLIAATFLALVLLKSRRVVLQ